MRIRPTARHTAWVAATCALLGACATAPGSGNGSAESARAATVAPTASRTPAPAAAPASAPGAAPAATPGAPGGPPPFASVIKDARRIDGPITLWQKEDKVWIELMPAQIGQPYLLSPKIKSGIGEAWVYGGLMALPINGAGGPQLVEFQRVHSQVRLVARNTAVYARPGTPEARALADTYSNSLLGAAPVASLPHPDRKSVLVEANAIFLSDMLGIGMTLQRGLRQGYGLDRANSAITAVRGTAQTTVIETQNHFYAGSIGTPLPGAPPGAPVPSVPHWLPDARSMLVGLHYSIAALPETPMAPRPADPRVGLFSSTVLDFSDDLAHSPRQRYVNRWRIEKKDPAAELSDPVKPVTFWIDRNVPLVYRETVRAAILEWNKAFEKIGIRGALKVEQQADDATFDTLDAGYNAVRWMLDPEPAFGAVGLSHVDPRTGEILDADIAFEGMSSRHVRALRTQVLQGPAAATAATLALAEAPAALERFGLGEPGPYCQHATLAAEQLGYALDVLQAQGELEPDSPIAQQFVQDYVKESIMHEVGHALGLRHNFRASRVYSEAQLADAEFTRAHGTAGSVMEYSAVNLPLPGRSGGVPFQTALGPYDFWAIEYAYKPLPAGLKPEQERAELQRIAARSSEPQLAYGTDEDSYFGLDPETIQLDLGADPVAFAAKRLAIARDLFQRQATRVLSPQRDYAVLRRSIAYALGDVTRAVGVLVRQIGGVRTLRDFPGSGRDPLQPVDAATQRQAMDLIASAVLAADGLDLPPALQRRLAPDYLDRAEGGGGTTDFSPTQRWLELQRAVLGYLMSDMVAARVLDSVGKFERPQEAFQLGELYRRLSADVWSELGSGRPIGAARRELQRDHANRLAAALVRPAPGARVDARGQVRTQARALLARLDAAQRRRGSLDEETRAHLADAAETLRLSLTAPLQRLAL